MGLDIIVGRPVKVNENDLALIESLKNEGGYVLLEENPEMIIFKDKIFEIENEYFDLPAGGKLIGYDVKDEEWVETSQTDDGKIQFIFKRGDETFKIIEPPTTKKKEMIIHYEEVGYQRKGANKKFYADGMWSSNCVVNKDLLLTHWNNYFSGEVDVDPTGLTQSRLFGYNTEYNLEAEECRTRFKQDIVDKFKEGETFVMYC